MEATSAAKLPARRSPSPRQLLFVVAMSLLALLSLTSLLGSTTRMAWTGRSTTSHSAFRQAAQSHPETAKRKQAIRDAMQFVWKNYHDRAFGADEIKPLDGTPSNPWGGAGCMILDSMDTLIIMDLNEEFEQARKWVHDKLRFDNMGSVSVFETIIRSLGGLLGAYDLSRDPVFLTKATELAERMIPAIDLKTGCADYRLNTVTNESYQPGTLAESGTYQLEFEYLSMATGNDKYSTIARKFYPYMRGLESVRLDGLYANEIYAFAPGYAGSPLTLTMGGGGDSFYEYLLKVWLLQGMPSDSIAKQMYLEAVEGIENYLLLESTSGALFVVEYSMRHSVAQEKMQHLACFVPGMLALGAKRLQSEDPRRSEHHLNLAKRLGETCYKEFYAKRPTGLSPEYLSGKAFDQCTWPVYLLRPEAVESLYILFKVTGDPIYQEWGWNIFTAIERNCKTDYGFSEFKNVFEFVDWANITTKAQRRMTQSRVLTDRQETFFAAETLKYLYLLFDPDNSHISLDTHVFNTEAHPLSILGKKKL